MDGDVDSGEVSGDETADAGSDVGASGAAVVGTGDASVAGVASVVEVSGAETGVTCSDDGAVEAVGGTVTGACALSTGGCGVVGPLHAVKAAASRTALRRRIPGNLLARPIRNQGRTPLPRCDGLIRLIRV